jgi:tetratricopeptide (TPR) repeat protein
MRYRSFSFVIFFIALVILLLNLSLYLKNTSNSYSKADLEVNFSDSYQGNYLAGYYALKNNYMGEAAEYFDLVLQQYPDNLEIIKDSYIAHILSGDVDRAIDLINLNPQSNNGIILTIKALKDKNYDQALSFLKVKSTDNENYIDGSILTLISSWCHAYKGNYSEALNEIEYIDHKSPSFAILDRYNLIKLQQALILDLADNSEKAEAIYDNLAGNNQSFLMIKLAGNFYERAGKIDKAKNLYAGYGLANPLSIVFSNDLKRLDEKKYLTEKFVSTPTQGVNLLLSELANLLFESKLYNVGLIYAQLGVYLDPYNEYTNIAIANYYNSAKDYEKSLSYLKKIPENSFLYESTKLNIAEALFRSGNVDQAKNIFNELQQRNPDNLEPILLYADLLQENEQIEESIKIYSSIIANFKEQKPYQWYIYYMRGFNYNLTKDFVNAEEDLTEALKLNPTHYSIMNDLAYGWVTEKRNLDQALVMIKKALDQSPNSPQIMDSLGWALYMQGKYNEAASLLEKASELLPSDSTIYDHLGDAYWKIGHKIIAKFEWQYAIDHSKDPEEQERLQNKINNGLPEN